MSSNIDLALKVAWAMYGTAYKWGGDDPVGGTDCSGFISEILRSVGEIGPKERLTTHTIWQRYGVSRNNAVDEDDIDAGDIILYSKDDTAAGINHVVMALGPNFIIEAGGGWQDTDTLAEAAAANAFVRVRPLDRKRLFAALRIID